MAILVALGLFIASCSGGAKDTEATGRSSPDHVLTTQSSKRISEVSTTTLVAATSSTEAPTTMTVSLGAEDRALVDAYVSAWNSGDLDGITALFHTEVKPWFVSAFNTSWEITVDDHISV